MNYAVVMAGGKGERFWPLSRAGNPKQFLKILSEKTLLEDTLLRIADLVPMERTIIVAGENFKNQIIQKIGSFPEKNLLVEPEGKNTCLAIGLSAIHLYKKDPEAVVAVFPSDHAIEPKERLVRILKAAMEVARKGEYLITVGVVPARAETGYGYIELGEKADAVNDIQLFKVARFKEKPNRILAQEYYLDRKHLWNSGILVWSAAAFLKALETHQPQLFGLLQTYSKSMEKPGEWEARKKLFDSAESISVDFAILEKATNVLAIQSDFMWDDVGSFLALERVRKKDRQNNVKIGASELFSSYETTVVNEGNGIVVGFGVSDLVIVKTDDIVLVAHKTKAADLKEVTEKLAADPNYKKYL